jgi:hypothetical protein
MGQHQQYFGRAGQRVAGTTIILLVRRITCVTF